jgi:hypothetical protein
LAVGAVACGGQPLTTSRTGNLPAELESGRRQFEQGRQGRKLHTPIPERLWVRAVKLAGKYGVSRTSRILRLGYHSLQERVPAFTSASKQDAAGN